MHKLIDYVCEELKELEKKAEKGDLSMAEVEYADKLAHLKKNLLKGEEMGYSSENRRYSRERYSRDDRGRGSYANRDSMGRYSSAYSMAEDFKSQLEEVMQDAPNEHIRQKLQRIMAEI